MPRRRKIEIKASELACFDTLVEELRSRVEFANLDPTSVRIWAYEEYEPTLKNADRIIRRFDYWLGVHKEDVFVTTHTGSRLFCKKELAKALGIARPTLDRWIANGWLKDCAVPITSHGDDCYSADAVRSMLEQFR